MAIRRARKNYRDLNEATEELATILDSTIQGKLDNQDSVTLTTGSATTTVTDPRVSIDSVVFFMPTTANAATELTSLYVTGVTNGSFTINHNNSATADRTYKYAIFG